MKTLLKTPAPFFFIALILVNSCNTVNKKPAANAIAALNLKRGDVISCGPPDKEFGTVDFAITGNVQVNSDFNIALALLHSFEYDESEKAFAKIIDESPECAMAYWGVAMSNFHALWEPPTEAELKKGSAAIEIANKITNKSEKESGYINAVAAYYKDWDKTDAHTRSINFEKAMEQLHNKYPGDKEAAIFYALALNGAALPTDKTYTNQKKAGAILNALYAAEPNHPGIVHYIIHTYDYPGLANLALPAARRYAKVAPSSAHALHMPSHIFTRLGLWDDCIQSNLASVSSAKCYAEAAGINGHWDEELHGLDYLMYAYLQKGENDSAKKLLDYLKTIDEVFPVSFKAAYAFASIPSRYLLENKFWKEAASLNMHPLNFSWQKFPWQRAMFCFTRLLGAVHTNHLDSAKNELINLQIIYDTLQKQKDLYKATQVMIQMKTGEAWIAWKEGKINEAVLSMAAAADMEDKTEKLPVTPGAIIPARELLGDMFMAMNKPKEAFVAYDSVLKKQPNRFNGLYGAASASEKMNDINGAAYYYKQLLMVANSADANRPELDKAEIFLGNQKH